MVQAGKNQSAAPLNAGEEGPPIEKAWIDQSFVKGLTDSPLFEKCVDDWGLFLSLPKTSSSVLEAFSGLDVKADELARILSENPYYEFQFRKMIESLGKRESVPSVNAAIVLMGMQRSRDLVLALQTVRTMTGKHPEWSKEGKLQVTPSEILSYAAKIEDSLAGSREAYASTAYSAGIMFDVLVQLAKSNGADLKSIQPFIDSIFAHGLKAAQSSIALAAMIPDFAFKKYLYSACLIHDIGKVLMVILQKDYMDFHGDAVAKALPRGIRHYVEKKRFGVSHDVLGALYCMQFSIFEPISKAVLFHHEPFMLKTSNKNLYQLAVLMALSSNVANFFRKPEKADDPVIFAWKGPELNGVPLDSTKLTAIVTKLVASAPR